MKERICPSCGESVQEARSRFCPFCGAALPEPETTADDTARLEEQLRQRYRDYDAWVILTRSKEGGGTRILELITGRSNFKSSEKHEEFFRDVGALAAELLAAYQAAPGSGDLAALLRYVLIDCHGGPNREADWLHLVMEQHFLPFLDLLSQPAAAALYVDYRLLRKKQKGFAFQTKILKTLKRLGQA